MPPDHPLHGEDAHDPGAHDQDGGPGDPPPGAAQIGRPELLDDLRSLAGADAMALDELAAILGQLRARAAEEPDAPFDRDAIWSRVERQLDRTGGT